MSTSVVRQNLKKYNQKSDRVYRAVIIVYPRNPTEFWKILFSVRTRTVQGITRNPTEFTEHTEFAELKKI